MFALLAIALTAAGPIDAVISRSIDTTPERAEDVLVRVTDALTLAGLNVRAPAETKRLLPAGTISSQCAARRACVRELGVALGSHAIVGVDIGHVTGQMAVTLEAISTTDGQKLAQHSFSIDSAGYPAGIDAAVQKFSKALKLALPAVVAADAPVAVKLEPAPVAPPVEVVAAPSRPVGPLVLAGVGVAAVITAVALAVVGSSTAGQLEQAKATYMGMPASNISRAQAEEIAATANGQYTSAGIAGGAGVALGVGALLWWAFGD